ncbi:MAG: DUF262 domain-containing protein [Mycobacterium sp.]|uniref:DUF262 domain-containing protein n=1 Tax=Mycobacterium sp. TaxID=1785 RepID=UPI003F9CF8A2
MAALYKDTGYTLNHLVLDIGAGRIALPDIQRPFVWSSAKARDLFDSMYRGYPIGTIMFWETGVETGTRKIGDSEDRSPQLLIVDGQQRLTSLYAVLTGQQVLTKTFDKKHIRIGFRPSDETFEVTDAAIEKDPEFIPDITALWTDGRKKTVRQFLKRLGEMREGGLSEADEDLLEDRLDKVHDLEAFRFQVIELASTADEEQVAEIFVRINSEGVKLNQADFILTLMSVHWEKGRRALEAFSRAAVDASMTGPSPRNPYIDPSPDQMLRAGVALAFRRARCRWRRVRRRHDPVPPPPPVRGWPPTLPTRCVTGRSPRPPSSPLSTTTRSRCCSPGWTRRKMPCAWPTGDRGSIAAARAARRPGREGSGAASPTARRPSAAAAAPPPAARCAASRQSRSFARSRGFYAGLSFAGTVVSPDDAANQVFYGKPVSALDILERTTARHDDAAPLQQSVARLAVQIRFISPRRSDEKEAFC